MYNIAIIGSGQLGSRHLQGIKTAGLSLSIEVVDSNIEALKIAEDRYNEIGGNHYIKNVNFLSSIEELSDSLDLVIIATSSAPRFLITRNLIEKKHVGNIIFEKVLFQNEESFFAVKNLLKSNNIKAWVNCPRRMYDYYNEIKRELNKEDKLIFTVFGGDWGLGCNSIHFIDLFSYLSRQKSYTLLTDGLNKRIYPSKRSGYIEFCGILSGTTERGDILNLISQENSTTTPLVSIVSQNKKYVIDETKGYMTSFKDNRWETKKITVPYQSQLTGRLIEAILLNKNSKITEYEESMNLHLPFISSLLDFYNSLNGENILNCPIT
ncbi:MAG: Gfo/Idh/MocA family oxidoreductase [Erysipelotrichales bacterium]|nr:Gfo/Idh/MocA family oxidoreductase [Erysipelotrichales bacterium]